MLDDERQDNIIAALEHHDRVIQINIGGTLLETFFAVTRMLIKHPVRL